MATPLAQVRGRTRAPAIDPWWNGRDAGGRFSKGNPGGPGNPHASKVSRLRSALLEAVTADDIRSVIDALVTEAKTGNVPAIREFFNRVLGQAHAIDAIERLAEVEVILERLEATAAPDLIP